MLWIYIFLTLDKCGNEYLNSPLKGKTLRNCTWVLLCVLVTQLCDSSKWIYTPFHIFFQQNWSQSAIHSVNYALYFSISTRKLIIPIFYYIMRSPFCFFWAHEHLLSASFLCCRRTRIYKLLNNKNFPIKREMVNNGDKELM